MSMGSLQEEIARLNQRMETMEEIVRRLLRRTHRINQALNLTDEPSDAATSPRAPTPAAVPAAPPQRAELTFEEAPRRPTPAPKPRPAARTTADWETLIGGKWAQWVGTVAVLVALSFFLAYSFQWIGPVGRVMIGLFGGVLLLAGGELVQDRTARWFAQGLTGAGLAILYLTLYAAYNSYHLLAMPSAFGLMALVTATGVALSVRYDAISTIALATGGGFLTPVLVRETPTPGVSEAVNAVPFLAYVALLNGGILAVSAFRNWREINLLVLAATSLLLGSWLGDSYHDELRWVTLTFVTVYFLVFVAVACLYNLLRRKPTDTQDLFLIFATPALYFGLGWWLLHEPLQNVAGVFPLLLCAFYLGLGYEAIDLVPSDRRLTLSWLGLALTFLTIAIPMQLRGHWITVAWAVEAAVLTYIGFSVKSQHTRHTAVLVWALVVFRLLFFPVTVETATWMLLLNKRFLTFIVAIATTLVMAYLYRQNRSQLVEFERPGVTVFGIAANLLAVWALTAETYDFFRQQQFPAPATWENAAQLGVSLVWTVYSALVLKAGMNYRYQPARLFALLLFGVTVFKVFLFDLSFLSTPFRILSFGGLGAVLFLVSWLYSHFRDQIRELALGEGGEAQ